MLARRALQFSCFALFLLEVHNSKVKRHSPVYRSQRSDDMNAASLEVLVQQQAAMIQTLQAELASQKADQTATKSQLSAVEARLRTLEDKQSKAVAFSVRFSGDNIALGDQSTLKFDNVVTNIGNGYSPLTGIFTTPVAGVYTFFLSEMSHNSHTYLNLEIVKEGTVLDLVYADGSFDVNDQGSSLVTTHLLAGQRVWVRQFHGDMVRGSWLTIFTGFLVHTD